MLVKSVENIREAAINYIFGIAKVMALENTTASFGGSKVAIGFSRQKNLCFMGITRILFLARKPRYLLLAKEKPG
jgi:hypothetical protein